MWQLEKYCKGLADGSRLRILNLLLHGELCGCDIQYVLAASQPNVSRHLQYLKNSGLVLDRREGYRVYYRLSEPSVGPKKHLFEFLRLACRNADPFRSDTRKLRDAIEHGACSRDEWQAYGALHSSRTGTARL